jgi:hypothetical protein
MENLLIPTPITLQVICRAYIKLISSFTAQDINVKRIIDWCGGGVKNDQHGA